MHELAQINTALIAKSVKRMVMLSSARPTDCIAVVGPQSLEYVIALFVSGFQNAVCLSGGSPRVCGEPIDHLFISGSMRDEHLRAVIASVGGHLRQNGVIVARLRDALEDQVISKALSDIGLLDRSAVVQTRSDMFASHHPTAAAPFAIAA